MTHPHRFPAATVQPGRIVISCLWVVVMMCVGCERPAGDAQSSSPAETSQATAAITDGDLILASQALRQNDLLTAEAAIRRHLLIAPNDVRALELAGDLASRRGDTEQAITMYQATVEQASSPSELLLDKLAQQLMRASRAFDSVTVLQERIERYPNSWEARSDLVGLVAVLGMPNAAVPSLRWLSQHGHGDPESLQVLADPRRVEADEKLCQNLLQRRPQDLRPEYGLARLDAGKMDWPNVIKRLGPVLEKHQDFVPAYTLYGLALTELNEFDQIPEWQARAPEGAESSSEYWLVAGLWSQQQGKQDEAARAFWESIRLDDSSDPLALTRLAQSLEQLGRGPEASKVAEQITMQAALRDALKTHLERSARSQLSALRMADAMMDLGRIWEAEGWARLAVSLPEDRQADIAERYMSIRSQLTVDTPWQSPEMKLASQVDLSDLPLVDWVPAPTMKTVRGRTVSGEILLEDQAKQRGWTHTCKVAAETVKEGHWIYHSVGGGVGVIDFDLDGWPDLAAAMLDGKPLQSDSSPNRLFRNLAGQFVECTTQADYLDTGFAQGITVGDFNDDGFPDLFDANIGRNRLYRNNGDGTFQEVASQVGLDGEVWTTSAVIADIDGDGFADLYEAEYCGGREPFERPCRNSKGIIATCQPLKFEAEPDRVWRGVGDGTFVNATADWMEQTSPGRGLGVLAGQFDERPGLDLYVANDMTVNHLWSGSGNEGHFRLTDLAAIRGLGFSGRSISQASMGMAAGDPDGDGDIDFFLTHFSDDHNTYYEQVAPGLWSDRSFQVGLSTPSMNMLGFGTQWVDLDNNGELELMVANGHVDDVESGHISYRMPPQMFQQDERGLWSEMNRTSLGKYFAEDHLGRALATLDADRDGKVDVAITHLYEPVALLINQTVDSGQAIALELKSTRGQRDAIGATVTMTVGDRTVTSQLTAGDGYMCSNQRRITVGTAAIHEVSDVTVTWPSGEKEEFGTLASGHEHLLLEGSAQAYQWQGKP